MNKARANERWVCWCDEVDDRSCTCGHLPYNLGWHALNCPEHPNHRECFATREARWTGRGHRLPGDDQH